MNSITYHKYRDELHGLLAKGVAELTRDQEQSVQELKKTATTLDRVKNKLTEDQFTIALVSDFQGGKSTTFNILCDGRLLSPRGFGIKTSGCQIVAQNHNGPDESALVWWRTSQELIAGFGDLLSPYFNRLDPQRFLGDDKALDTKLNLDQDADRQLVRQAAMQALADHGKNRRSFSDELLDVARCAAVTAEFYASPHLKGLRDRAKRTESGRLVTQLKPDEIRNFVRFPVDWKERWGDADPARFQAEGTIAPWL